MKHPDYLVVKPAGKMGRFAGGKWVKKDGETFGCPKAHLEEAAKLGYHADEKKAEPSKKNTVATTDNSDKWVNFLELADQLTSRQTIKAIDYLKSSFESKVKKDGEALKAELAELEKLKL